MAKANCYRVIQVCFALALLLAPASSQEVRREAPQTPSPQNSQTVDAQDEQNAEQSRWDSIVNESNPQEYKTLLWDYPQGRFADTARARLGVLLGEDFVTLFMKRIDVNKRWANVEKQLVRRVDFIPVFVQTLMSAGVLEQEFFGQLAEMRSRLLNATNATPQGEHNAKTPEQKQTVIDADNYLNKVLRGLNSLTEVYPQLLSNAKYLGALDELTGVENRIAVARMDYNNTVVDYNAARTESRMAGVAKHHGFTEEPYFKSDQGLPAQPKIKSGLSATTHLFHGGHE